MIKNFKAALCAFLLAGVTLCANVGAPLAGSTAYIQKHKAAAQKHEAIMTLLESRVPELTTGFLNGTEWMFDHAKPTKAEKQQGKDFIAALNASSGLTKKEKARVRGFVNRSIGVWSGGKIAGVTIGSAVGLFSVIHIGLFFAQFKRMRREEKKSWGNRSGASKYGLLQQEDYAS
ncbi:MAG: hypothetical protein WCJ17_00865 [bacterium]